MNSWNKTRPKTARELGIMTGFPPPPEKQPSADNWDLPPFNRWSFQHMRSLFPTVDVYRGSGPVSVFSRAEVNILDTKFTNSAGQVSSIQQFLDETYTDGLLIYPGGKIRHESYYNDMAPETLHLSQSVAKSVVGTTTGILIQRGELDPNRPLARYVKELATCGYGDATLSDVLNMQSGVQFNEDYGTPDSDMTRVDIAARGVFGQLIYVDRISDLMVVKLSSWPDYLIHKFTLDTFLAIDAIREAL